MKQKKRYGAETPTYRKTTPPPPPMPSNEEEGCELCSDTGDPNEVKYYKRGIYIDVSMIKLGSQMLMKVDVLPVPGDNDFKRSEAFVVDFCPNCGRRIFK